MQGRGWERGRSTRGIDYGMPLSWKEKNGCYVCHNHAVLQGRKDIASTCIAPLTGNLSVNVCIPASCTRAHPQVTKFNKFQPASALHA